MRVERSPKWVRAFVEGTAVVDSRDAMLFWEDDFPVPSYAFPREDVRTDLLVPSREVPHEQPYLHQPKGPVSRWWDLVVGGRRITHAAWHRDAPELGARLVFTWRPDAFDQWLEEDVPVSVHPRDPHKRVEALTSTRHVIVELDGVRLAESHHPVLLFETGLPTRYYLPPTDVRLDLLEATTNTSQCPYKGTADRYWSVRGRRDGDNLVWSYTAPRPEVSAIAGHLAFYDEDLDIIVDVEQNPRPSSVFTKKSDRPAS